jgi:membrane protease YdiL (CAAX protease family)
MNSRAGIPYISQFFILLGLLFGGFILAGAAAIAIWYVMVGGNLLNMEKGMLNPANANAVKVVQLVSSMIMFLLPALVFARIVNKQPAKHLGLKTRFSISQVGLVIAMVFAGFYLSGALAELTNLIPISAKAKATFEKMEKAYVDQVMVIANMKTFGEYLFSLIVIALAPAIFEEVIFRGALQQMMVKWTRSAWIGIIITSIIFSAIHFSYYGFLSRTFLGIVLGFMFYYSKSLWPSIIAHFLNNGFAVTAMYVYSKQGKLSKEVMDERFPIWYGVAALAVIVALFIAYKNESKKMGTYYLDNTETKGDDPFQNQQSVTLRSASSIE